MKIVDPNEACRGLLTLVGVALTLARNLGPICRAAIDCS